VVWGGQNFRTVNITSQERARAKKKKKGGLVVAGSRGTGGEPERLPKSSEHPWGKHDHTCEKEELKMRHRHEPNDGGKDWIDCSKQFLTRNPNLREVKGEISPQVKGQKKEKEIWDPWGGPSQ